MQEQHLPWVHEFRKWFIPSYRTALAGCDDALRVSSFLRESCSSNFPPEHCMWHISWSANMLVEPKSRHRSHIQQVCKNVPPPFLRTTPKSVRWQHPIKYINAFHSLVVHVNKMWLVNWILIPFLYTSFYFVNWIHTTVVAGNCHSWVVIPLHSQYCTIWSVIEIASLSLFDFFPLWERTFTCYGIPNSSTGAKPLCSEFLQQCMPNEEIVKKQDMLVNIFIWLQHWCHHIWSQIASLWVTFFPTMCRKILYGYPSTPLSIHIS